QGTTIPVPNDGGTPPVATTITITDATSIDDYVSKFNTAGDASSPALTDYVKAYNINGNLVIQTLDTNYDVEFSASLKTTAVGFTGTETAAPTAADTTDTYASSAFVLDGTNDYAFTYSDDAGGTTTTLNITDPADLTTVAAAISGITDFTASVNGSGELVIVNTGTTNANYIASFSPSNLVVGPIDKNNNFSGRSGAGAEFIEIVTTIDQTASQGSQQLRLDTLGISDSAFGEFSVDATGLITMKQDGADFAIGQVSIALFNNNRGLEPRGDNLLAKTNDSGDPIFNVNNDKTAKIEGQTLELSTADLSESLVNLMVFQRAFEANAKSITTADQLLNTLINLKRS
ncbi:MAG: flagellar hook-basal body complex protein, partial [Campylobacterota bacterium]|nr:flagellar hook-basal body complex protein [Campylobacterota bacterium]